MPLPNFLIIGDFKAGTTSLYSYLRQHPEVYMPSAVKELRFFSYDPQNSYHQRAKSTVVRSLDEYRSHFEACGEAKAIGEASPAYLRSPGAAARIHALLPNARLIVCLRNPADRLHSAHQMRYRSTKHRRPLDESLFSNDAALIKANFYWLDLSRYFELFPREHIHVILFEELIRDPAAAARGVYEFLGVDPHFVPDFAVQNAGGMPRNVLLYRSFDGLRKLLKSAGVTSRAARNASAKLRRGLLTRVPLDPLLRRQILEVCRDDIQRTQQLIGRDLSDWLRQ